MADYAELVCTLRGCAAGERTIRCNGEDAYGCWPGLLNEAADAIEELFKSAEKMHLWIFLHSGDEQAAYDECGLTDEMNAALGYGGRFEIKADPCADCVHYPPSSTDGKPCCACDPANPLTNCYEAKGKP